MTTRPLTIVVLPDLFAVCRLAPDAPIPYWASATGFSSITRLGQPLAERSISACLSSMTSPIGETAGSPADRLQTRATFSTTRKGALRPLRRRPAYFRLD
jgi:hypothetical protein